MLRLLFLFIVLVLVLVSVLVFFLIFLMNLRKGRVRKATPFSRFSKLLRLCRLQSVILA